MRFAALAGSAAALAAVDLVHKGLTGADHFHARSGAYVLGVAALALIWALAILATRSLSMALGGGILLGGAAGNLLSLSFWPGVPNPIVVEPIAFNLADLFVLVGFATTASTTLVFALRNRERLGEPVRLGRAR